MIDYLIVGGGLAGTSFASLAEDAKKNLILIDNENKNVPSRISFGLFHPFLLKRSKPCWRGVENMKKVPSFFQKIEDKTSLKFIDHNEIKYIFSKMADQNSWAELRDKPLAGKYIDPKIYTDKLDCLETPFGWSKILKSGRIDIRILCQEFKKHLKKTNRISFENFEHNKLSIQKNSVEYKGLKAKYIIFSEGYNMTQNPFFNHLPLVGNKAEVLTLKIPPLSTKHPIRSKAFLAPLGNNTYGSGTTYDREDKTITPTKKGKETILKQLKTTLTAKYEIINHQAAIRPATKDRKPLVGTHPEHKPLAVLNGLGGRGILNTPYTVTSLFNFLEQNTPIPKDISIERFSR